MNKKAQLAWEMYLKMEQGTESFNLLLLIANDCYRMGDFWYAAKAFDMLDRLEPNPEFWEGKRGAIVGVFQVNCVQWNYCRYRKFLGGCSAKISSGYAGGCLATFKE